MPVVSSAGRGSAEPTDGHGGSGFGVPGTAGTASTGASRAAGLFVAVAAVLAGWVWASDRFFAHAKEHTEAVFPGSGLLRGWVQFDGGWYGNIADQGYALIEGAQSNVAFFPLYPLTMRALRDVFGSSYGAGIAVTFLCGLAAAVLFRRWCSGRIDPASAETALVLLVLYPYSWYLVGAVYADALYLLAGLAAFLALERDRPLVAGLLGALATATRPVGPAIVVALAVRQLERRGALRTTERRFLRRTWTIPVSIDRRRVRLGDVTVLLSALGFAAYSGFLWWRWGDPLLFSTVQKYWNQSSGPVTVLKLHLAGIIVFKPAERWLYILGCLFQGGLSVGAVLLVPRIRRTFGWGYASLVLLSMAIPLVGSKDFQGLGRYLLAAFPVFAWAGSWLTGRSARTRRAVLAGSAVLLLTWSHLYARGHYVA